MKKYSDVKNNYVPLEYAGIDVRILAWSRTKFRGVAIGSDRYISRGLSHVLYGDTEVYGYLNNVEAVAIAKRYMEKENVFVSLYFDDIDVLSHTFGPESEETLIGIESLWKKIKWLLDKLPPGSDAYVIADHGQVQLDPEKFVYINDGPITEFRRKYNCDIIKNGNVSLVYLPPEKDVDAAADELKSILGDDFFIAKMKELGKKLYGNWNEKIEKRCGQLAILSMNGAAIVGTGHSVGNHGSLSRDELTVPVIHIMT